MPGGATGQHDRVVPLAQLRGGDVDTDVHPGLEDGALGLHLRESAVDEALLHLEFRDAVAQQTTDAVGALEDRHGVTGPGQLLCGGQTGRAGTDHGDLLAGEAGRVDRGHPALVEGVLDELDLDLLDRHRILVDAEDTGRLARRRAQPPGELREVVGRVQPVDTLTPLALVNQVVPLRDEVAQRTAVVTERNTAVHTPAGLGLQGLVRETRLVDLFPVQQAQRNRTTRRQFPFSVLQKSLRVSHVPPPNSHSASSTSLKLSGQPRAALNSHSTSSTSLELSGQPRAALNSHSTSSTSLELSGQPRAASIIASSTSVPFFSASEIASKTFLYSRGITFTKWFTCWDQSLRMRSATAEPV